MSTTTTAPKPAASKVPAIVYYRKDDEIAEVTIEKALGAIVKEGKIKDTKDASAGEIAKRLWIQNTKALPNAAEIPPEFEDLGLDEINDKVHAMVSQHAEIKMELDQREKDKKELNRQQKEEEKARKEQQDKEFAKNSEEFGDVFVASANKFAKKTAAFVENFTTNLQKSMPNSVQVTGGGMGVTIAKGASREDTAAAAAAAVGSLGMLKDAQGALQFMIGDILNGAVAGGTFPKKADAASAIKMFVQDKCAVKWEIGHIQACALAAERIPVEKRQKGVPFSHYLAVSKLTLPRKKEAAPADVAVAEKEVEDFRGELLEKINASELNGSKLNSEIETFKEAKGFIKPKSDTPARIAKAKETLFFTKFLISIAGHDDTTKVMRGKELYSYTMAELQELHEDAFNELAELIVQDNLKYDLNGLKAGTKVIEVKGVMKEEGYRMADPFYVAPKKEDKKAEPETVKTEEVETEVVETEEEAEVSDF